MTFRVGQKVVCVDDDISGKYLPPGFLPTAHGMDGLKKNNIYTIRMVGTEIGVPICRLVEIVRPFCDYTGAEAPYAVARFRPVVERKTSIEIFTAMLKPSKVGVDA